MANPLGRVPPRMLPQNFWVHSLLLPLGPQAIRKGWVPPKARRQGAKRRDAAARVAPDLLGPLFFFAGGTAGDEERRGPAEGAQVGGEAPVRGGILVARHIAAAAPILIADAPIFHVEGLGRSVGGAFVGERAALGVVAVFHPIAEVLRGAGTNVAGQVRLRANQAAELDELVGAKAVVLGVHAPVEVDVVGPLGGGADAVAPVIIVGEAAAGPAQHGDESLEIIHGLLPMAVDIGDFRILAYPEAAVNAASQVLGELSVEFGADGARLPGEIDVDAAVGGGRRQAPASGQDGGGGSAGSENESAAGDRLAHQYENYSTPRHAAVQAFSVVVSCGPARDAAQSNYDQSGSVLSGGRHGLGANRQPHDQHRHRAPWDR